MSSSSESSVKSITVDFAAFEGAVAVPFLLTLIEIGDESVGDNSFLTRVSSSFSESESRITTSPRDREMDERPDEVALEGEGDVRMLPLKLFLGAEDEFVVCLDRCASIHVLDPILLSPVCHSPSGSTSTSSTLSGVC